MAVAAGAATTPHHHTSKKSLASGGAFSPLPTAVARELDVRGRLA